MSDLRPHQTRAVADVRAAYARGCKRVLLVMPTGAGKTHAAAELIRLAVARGRRVLFAVHRREIVLDTHRRLIAAGVPCGLVMAGSPVTDAPVQVASVQTIAARGTHPRADLVIFDEAHHTAAETYRAIAAQYPGAYHLGLTATPERSDGVGMRDSFDELVIGATVAELTDAGYLAECDVVAPPGRQQGLAADPAEAWARLASGRPTVAFSRFVADSRALTATLMAQGVEARHIDGETPTRERDATLAAFARGEVQVLSNVGVLTEGWDSPRAKVCLLARGCGSAAVYLQMVGRILRPDGSGARALVIDLAGVVHEHGMPDELRAFSLDGIDRKPKGDREWISQCLACGFTVLGAKRGIACRQCGRSWPPPPQVAMVAAPLTIAAPVSRAERQATLVTLTATAKARGYKPGWVGVRFKEQYGFWPKGMTA